MEFQNLHQASRNLLTLRPKTCSLSIFPRDGAPLRRLLNTSTGGEGCEQRPSRTTTQPGVERQRGNEHGGKAAKGEGVEPEVPHVLCARSPERQRGQTSTG